MSIRLPIGSSRNCIGINRNSVSIQIHITISSNTSQNENRSVVPLKITIIAHCTR